MATRLLRFVNTHKNLSRSKNVIKDVLPFAAVAAQSGSLLPNLLNLPTTCVICLDNGLKVATEDCGAPTPTDGLSIHAGYHYQDGRNNRVAHFLEHMPFKGTDKRSQTDLEQKAIAGAGGVNHDELVKLAGTLFSIPKIKYTGEILKITPCKYTGSDVRVRDDAIPLLHVAIAVEGWGWCDADNIQLKVAKMLIGAWEHSHGGGTNNMSKLAQVCSKENLAFLFQSFNTFYKDTRLRGVYFLVNPLKSHIGVGGASESASISSIGSNSSSKAPGAQLTNEMTKSFNNHTTSLHSNHDIFSNSLLQLQQAVNNNPLLGPVDKGRKQSIYFSNVHTNGILGSFYSTDTVESVDGNALEDLYFDEPSNLVASIDRDIEAESPAVSYSITASLANTGLLGSSALVYIPGSSRFTLRVIGNSHLQCQHFIHTTGKLTSETPTVDKNQKFDMSSSSFIKQIGENHYVDKTMFIRQALELKGYNNISAPRRFMKSTNLKMLRTFVEFDVDKNGKPIELKLDGDGNISENQHHKNFRYFKGTKILQDQKFFSHNFGKYPVIYLSFNVLNGRTYEEVALNCVSMLRRLFYQHRYLLNATDVEESLKKRFNEMLKGLQDLNNQNRCFMYLKQLTTILFKHFKTPVLVLIDEYDSPLNEAIYNSTEEEMEKIFKFMTNFLVKSLKDNDYVHGGVFMSCTHVGGILSDKFNVVTHKFLSDEFVRFNGFTEEETENLIKKLDRSKRDLQTILDWYGGFENPSNAVKIVNSWSTMKFLQSGKIENNWTRSVPQSFISGLLKHRVFTDNFLKLIRGEAITMYYDSHVDADTVVYTVKLLRSLSSWENGSEIAKVDLHRVADLFFQYLWELGYLNNERNHKVDIIRLMIPNKEIKSHFEQAVLKFDVLKKYYGWEQTAIDSFIEACHNLCKNPALTQNGEEFWSTLHALIRPKNQVVFEFHSAVYEVMQALQNECKKLTDGNKYPVKEFLEDKSNAKYPDICLVLEKCLLVMELKFGGDWSEKSALKTALRKGYHTIGEVDKNFSGLSLPTNQITMGLHQNKEKLKLSYLIKDDFLEFELTEEKINNLLDKRRIFQREQHEDFQTQGQLN